MSLSEIAINLKEFKKNNGKPPSFIYIGYEEFYSLMGSKDAQLHIRYDAKANRNRIHEVPLFVVAEDSHFNIA